MQTGNSFDIENSPIFQGLKILTTSSSINELLEIVVNWRKRLWKE
jgi:hypothetical protein